MVYWDDLGFATNYAVEFDIEYPGDGDWGMPVVELRSALALPTPGPVAIIRPTSGDPWVLSAPFGQWTALYATPDPNRLCVLKQYESATLIDVPEPMTQEEALDHVVIVGGSPDEGLLFLGDDRSLTAVGVDGIVWQARDLVWDDLHVTRASGGRVYFRGFEGSAEIRGSLDAKTGTVLS